MIEPLDTYVARAVRWAKAHLGSPAYSTRCLSFVEDAYERSNSIEMFGGSTAKESADAYDACINAGQAPPIGALVFYDCFGTLRGETKNWGHVALCVGPELVIHAWNRVREDHYLDVQHLGPVPGWHQPRYVGWAPVARILSRHRRKVWGAPPAPPRQAPRDLGRPEST